MRKKNKTLNFGISARHTISLLLTIVLVTSSTSVQSQNTWVQKADFGGTARYGAVGFSIDGKGYIGTGFDFDSFTNDFWEYDPITNTWTQKADFGGTARYAAVGFSIASRGYIGTGYNYGNVYKDFWEYNPTTNTWTQKADFGGTARSGAVGFSIGDAGYIGTGYGSNSFQNDFWEYDPDTDTWTAKTIFGGTGRIASAGFSIGTKGYIGTGYDGIDKNDFWEYDPSTDSWMQRADFGGTARDGAVGFSAGNNGYIGTGGNSITLTNDFWEYNPSSNTWTQKADFSGSPRYGAAGYSIETKGYIGTGFDNSYNSTNDFREYTTECTGFTVYADADIDGFGDINISYFASDCVVPAGYVLDSSDCNDGNAAINPAESEVCDGIDNNCNGNIDEGVLITFYRDLDNDLYGDNGNSTLACSQPPGYATDSTDCNDADGSINPGETEICNSIDDNCNGQTDEGLLSIFYSDNDNDGYGDVAITVTACSAPYGYVSDSTDCNDSDASINPGATEICNTIDDNCNGETDEGVQLTFYSDNDNDGYGDATNAVTACSAPSGYVSNSVDCNDSDPFINPDATEICNTIDDNCNGETDEGVQLMFYSDNDNDGYGDATNSVMACSAPIGYVSDTTDCNDGDPFINPGAMEICNTIDDNCNGETDEGVQLTFYLDNDNDGYGVTTNTVLACSAPFSYVSDSTDCNDGDPSINPGAIEICNTIDDNCNGETDEGVQLTFYSDNDNDSYGNATDTVMACSAPLGYVSDNTDCNDGDQFINPGATEICNTMDDNCNGETDEGVQLTFYSDNDNDGYGDATNSVMACSAPLGYVSDSTDCNDGSPYINPGTTETCNSLDDNCNNLMDEGLAFTIYYQDADGDNYGNPFVSDSTCDGAPLGFVTDSTDCDDTNPSVYPGAQEITNNGIDDNCNGVVDEFGVGISEPELISDFTIYPNPTIDEAIISFSLERPSHVCINVFDVNGKEITSLLNVHSGNSESSCFSAGNHSLLLNVNGFSKGIYFVRLTSDSGIQNNKIVVQ